jgi:hypothetical protein
MSQLGRISGPLLKDNLTRDSVDLAFDTDLLYLDVQPGTEKIGINSDAPVRDLTVVGKSKIAGNFLATGTTATVSSLIINSTNTISSVSGPIIIEPTGADAYVEYGDVIAANLRIKDNFITAQNLNGSINFDPSGTGSVIYNSNTVINGNLQVDQNIRSRSNVQLNGVFTVGNNRIDRVTVNPDFTQSIIPGTTLSYDLGSNTRRWENFWLTGSFVAGTVSITTLNISDQLRFTGNTISSTQSNDSISLVSSTGNINIERLKFNNGDITNLNNSNITFKFTGQGFLTVNDTNAMLIPVGNNSQRVGVELGETRWNRQLGYMECFDGTVWQVATGGGAVITPVVMQELGHVYTLIFG